MDVFNGSNYFPTLLETIGLCVPNYKFRDINLFNVVTIKFETALLLAALWQKMPSTMILI